MATLFRGYSIIEENTNLTISKKEREREREREGWGGGWEGKNLKKKKKKRIKGMKGNKQDRKGINMTKRGTIQAQVGAPGN